MELPLLVLILVSLCGGQPWESPDFCHQKPCPQYQVDDTRQVYEVRSYVATEWLTTKMSGPDLDEYMSARSRLQKAAGTCERDPDAWPVLINVTNGTELSLSWFLPLDTKCTIQDTSVTLQRTPAVFVYVRQYGGKPSIGKAQENAQTLRDALDGAGKSDADSHSFTWAGYDNYFSLFYHNEIWIKKTD